MPNIDQFSPEIPNVQPNNLGASAFEQAARINRVDANEAGSAVGSGIAALGQPASKFYDQLVTQPEITRLTSQAALGYASLTDQYNKAMTAPGADPTKVFADFQQNTLQPFIDKLNDGASTSDGRDFVQKYGDDLTQHFGEKNAADQVSVAGTQAVQGIQTVTNAASLAANANPDGVGMSMKLIDTSIAATVKTLGVDPETAARITTELSANSKASVAVGALEGMISKNPQQAQQEIEGGDHDDLMALLKPDAQQSIRSYAAAQVKVAAEETKAATVVAQAQQKSDYETQVAKIDASAVDPNTGGIHYGPDAIHAVYGGPNSLAFTPWGQTHPQQVQTYYKAILAANEQYQSGQTIPNDPATFDSFRTRASLPPDSPLALKQDDINQAIVSGHLSAKSGSFFSSMIKDSDPTKASDEKSYNQFLTSVKPLVYPSTSDNVTGAPSYALGQRWVQFQQDIRQVYTALKGQGKSTSDLLNPQSKDYILNTFPLPKYQLQPDEASSLSLTPTLLAPVQNDTSNPGLASFFKGTDFGAAPGSTVNIQSLTNPPAKYKAGMSMDDLAKAVQ